MSSLVVVVTAHGDEPEHPVGQVVVPVHAEHEKSTVLLEANLQLRRGWGRSRPREKYSREVPDLSGCREQPVGRVVDALDWRIRSRDDDDVALAIQNGVIGFGERLMRASVRT